MSKRTLVGVSALGCLVASFWLVPAYHAQEQLPEPETVPPPRIATPTRGMPRFAAVGSASCSARACHGGLEPQRGPDQTICQNEFTLWLANDRHALAFRVLGNERSQSIARHLGIAHATEDRRCLVCHSNPLAVGEPVGERDQRRLGTGCESCHGAASQWFGPHTGASWKRKTPSEKLALGMIPVSDRLIRARACTGCHIGAGPNESCKLARDVNHDLIAAGHPRLDFEYETFMANMPAHWCKKTTDISPAADWAVGQAVSAQAALELLAYRAAPHQPGEPTKLWPEFAEYDCFACHHDLQATAWRQDPAHYGKRTPGAPAWGNWYLPMPVLLASRAPASMAPADPEGLIDSILHLRSLMQQPAPSADAVLGASAQSTRLLNEWLPVLDQAKPSISDTRALMRALASDGRQVVRSGWDTAMQLTYGLSALNRSLPADARLDAPIHDLFRDLQFPRTSSTRFDSPKEFQPKPIEQALEQILNAPSSADGK